MSGGNANITIFLCGVQDILPHKTKYSSIRVYWCSHDLPHKNAVVRPHKHTVSHTHTHTRTHNPSILSVLIYFAIHISMYNFIYFALYVFMIEWRINKQTNTHTHIYTQYIHTHTRTRTYTHTHK